MGPTWISGSSGGWTFTPPDGTAVGDYVFTFLSRSPRGDVTYHAWVTVTVTEPFQRAAAFERPDRCYEFKHGIRRARIDGAVRDSDCNRTC